MDSKRSLFGVWRDARARVDQRLATVAGGMNDLIFRPLNARESMLVHLSFATLVALRFYAFLQHEMWRVEAQLPLMVRDAPSFGQLMEWQSYGREHVLWPTLLYGLKQVGLDPVSAGQWLHLCFSVMLLGIIVYGIPRIPLIVRVLLGSSYFIMYEYTAMTRTYGLTALLLGVFIMLELRAPHRVLWKALALSFLALSSNLGLALAIPLTFYLLLKPVRARLRTKALALGIVALGIGTSVVTALPPSDLVEGEWLLSYRDEAFNFAGIPHLLSTSARIFLDGFLYIPTLTSDHWYQSPSWDAPQSLLSSVFLNNSAATYLIGLAVLGLAGFVLWRLFKANRLIAATIALFWGGNLLVWSAMNPGFARHFGFILLGTLGLLALFMAKDVRAPSRIVVVVVIALLFVQSMSGFWAVYAEGQGDFSQSKNLAQWMQATYPDAIPYVYPDNVGASLTLYTGGYARSMAAGTDESISFVLETEESNRQFTPEMITSLTPDGQAQLLITDFPFHTVLDGGNTVVDPIRAFQPSIEPHESFWVHEIRQGNESQPWTLKLLPFQGESWLAEMSPSGVQQRFVDSINMPDSRLDNEKGSTIELRMRLRDAPEEDRDAFVLGLMDGRRVLKVYFFKDGFGVRHDAPRIKEGPQRDIDSPVFWFPLRHTMDTTNDFHAYRFTMLGDTIGAYVDGVKVGSTAILDDTTDRRIALGGASTARGDTTAEIEYLAYSVLGALAPQSHVADNPGIWTAFTDMSTLFDVGPGIWPESGNFAVRTASDGMLTIGTKGVDLGHFNRVAPELQNALGSTAEIKLKLLEGPRSSIDGATFRVLDGTRGGGISFFRDRITVSDQNEARAVHFMDTEDAFHKYRLAIINDTLRVYADGVEVAAVVLSNRVDTRRILFGDFSPAEGENMRAKIDYIAFSAAGAMAPDGGAVEEKVASGVELWDEVRWALGIRTSGAETDPVGTGVPIDGFDNARGSTAEARLRILDAPSSGSDGALFSLVDGTREAKLSFFNDRIEILDQSDLRATHEMDTTAAFHTYRLALSKNTLWVHVDGEEVAKVTLLQEVTSKKILFGDLSSEEGENLHCQVEYLAYYTRGAMLPDGNVMPTQPAVSVHPAAPTIDDDLTAMLTLESVDPDGGTVGYTYAWFKDGALQPGINTNTVDSASTSWGENWTCSVTPNDGSLDGPAGEAQTTIESGIWTKLSGMAVLPEEEAASPWGAGGTFDTRAVSESVLAFATSGTNTGTISQGNDGFDNAIGSTVEVRMRILEAPSSGFNGAMLSFMDGTREAKINFLSDGIEIRDQNDLKSAYGMDTTDSFHVYRATLIGDVLTVFVDGAEVATVTLVNKVAGKAVLFGDFSPAEGENISAQVDYLGYSTAGAMAP